MTCARQPRSRGLSCCRRTALGRCRSHGYGVGRASRHRGRSSFGACPYAVAGWFKSLRGQCCFGGRRWRLGFASRSDFRSAPYAQQKVSSVLAAISGNCVELFAMPPDRKSRSHGKRPLNPDTCPGFGGVLQNGGHTKGRTTIVLPHYLGDCPHHLPWLDVALVHALCIGNRTQEFSELASA